MQILALIDIKKAREGFKKMVCSNEHRLKILIEHAEICYVYSNESNKLVEEMNIWKGNVDNIEVINKIEEIKKSVRDKVDD